MITFAFFASRVRPYSDSDGEALIKNTSEDPLVHENTTWDSNVSLTTLSKVTFKGRSVEGQE